jgi:modulator of FtsH protease HflC
MNTRFLGVLGFLVLVLGFIGFSSLYTVHQTQQALVLQFGKPVKTVSSPGLKFKIPFIQNVEFLENRILSFDAPAEEIIASDQKRLVVDSFIRYKISDPLEFYKSVSSVNIARSRLSTILTSSLRRVLGGVPLANVLTGERAELMEQIRDSVNSESRSLGIDVVDVRIKRADLPEANSAPVYARMNTEREREAREYRAQGAEVSQRITSIADRERTIIIAEAQRDSQILRGEGDALSVKLSAEAFGKDVEFYAFYRSMQAYRVALGKGDTTMVLSPDSEFFRFFGNILGQGNKP